MEGRLEENKNDEDVDINNLGKSEILKLIYGEIKSIPVRSENLSLRQDFNKLIEDTGKEIVIIKSRQDDIEKSQDFVAAINESTKNMAEGLLNNHSKLEARILKLEAANKDIKNEAERVNIAVNNQENRNRKWCVEINGMPTTKEENDYQIVEKIGNIMNINFDSNQVDIAHRKYTSYINRPGHPETTSTTTNLNYTPNQLLT